MTVSNQILEVLNGVCAKFGVVLDWTAANMLPVLENLVSKFIRWEMATSTIWLLLAVAAAAASWCIRERILKTIGKECEDYDFAFFMSAVVAVIISIIAIIVVCVQIFDVVEAALFPEKTVVEYIQALIRNA